MEHLLNTDGIVIYEHPQGHIPAIDNPYWHDAYNVGMTLEDALMDDSLDQVHLMSYRSLGDRSNRRMFQLIDQQTGKRFIIELPKKPEE